MPDAACPLCDLAGCADHVRVDSAPAPGCLCVWISPACEPGPDVAARLDAVRAEFAWVPPMPGSDDHYFGARIGARRG